MKRLPKLSIVSLFIVAFFTFSFLSCSSSDNDSTNDSQKTFLEKFDGTLWKQEGTVTDRYIYFEKTEANAVSVYWVLSVSDNCYYLTSLDEYDSVFENSENTLVIKSDYNNGDYDLDTYSFVNGKMTYNMFEFYNGGTSSFDYDLTEILSDPSSFITICN